MEEVGILGVAGHGLLEGLESPRRVAVLEPEAGDLLEPSGRSGCYLTGPLEELGNLIGSISNRQQLREIRVVPDLTRFDADRRLEHVDGLIDPVVQRVHAGESNCEARVL